MAYSPTDWADGTTPVDEAHLDKIEQGIVGAHTDIAALASRVAAEEAQPDLPAVVNGQWLKGAGGVPVWAAITQADVGGLSAALGAKLDKAIMDAKGDLLGATADDTPARVPAGTDGHVLTADTSQALGLKWAAPAAGGADLSYDGDYVPAATYQDGDVVVKDGVAYLCVGGPTTVAPDIAPWGTAGLSLVGNELAYAERLTDYPVTAASAAAAGTVLSATVACDGVTPILIEFFAPCIATGTDSQLVMHVWEDGTDLGQAHQSSPVGAALLRTGGAVIRLRRTPAAGLHTYTIRAWKTASTNPVIHATPPYLPAALRVSLVVPVPPQVGVGALTAVTYGTSLPASPADGQEAILVDSTTVPTYQWRFRWNAQSAFAHKWEFLGGSPMKQDILTVEVRNAATYGDLATVGPSLTVPRTGEYVISLGAAVLEVGGFNPAQLMSVQIGAAAALDVDAVGGYGFANTAQGMGRDLPTRTLTAGTVLVAKYKSPSASNWSNRRLALTPARVA